jgi:hypothetical protein
MRRSFVAIALLGILASLPVVAGIIQSTAGGGHVASVEPAAPGENTAPVWTGVVTESINQSESSACAFSLATIVTDAEMDSLTFTNPGGGLPAGCSLSTPNLAGTPTTPGTYNFTLGVNDGETAEIVDGAVTSLAFQTWEISPAQIGRVTFTATITPVALGLNLVCGFTDYDTPTAYGNIRTPIRLYTANQVQAYNGSYTAENDVEYTTDPLTLVWTLDLQGQSWDATAGGIVIADDYAFRTANPEHIDRFVCVDAAPGTVGSSIDAVQIVQPVLYDMEVVVVATGDTDEPAQPDPPTVSLETHLSVTLTMPTSAALDHNHYILERADDCIGASFVEIDASADEPTHVASGLTSSSDYGFRIIDVDHSNNESTPSTCVLGATIATPPNEWPKLTWDDVGHTGSLTTYTGPNPVVIDGTTIEDAFFNTALNVHADNVTIRNSHFKSCTTARLIDFDAFEFDHTNLLVEDSTFEGSTSAQLITGGGTIVRRSRFRDALQDNVKLNGKNDADDPVIFEGNYFEGLGQSGTDWHADGFQISKSSSELVTIRGNTFNTPALPYLDVVPGGCNEARGGTTTKMGRTLFWTDDAPAATSVQQGLVEYNYIEGSQYMIRNDGLVPGNQLIFRYNTVGREFHNAAWYGGMINYGNVWETSGVVSSPNILSGSFWYGPWVAGEELPDQDTAP